MITYSYYPFSEGKSKNPYKVVSPDQLRFNYTKTSDNITFEVPPVKIGKQNPAGIEIEFIQYMIGVAETEEEIKGFTSCNIGLRMVKSVDVTVNFEEKPELIITNDEFDSVFPDNNGTFFIGARA